MHKEIKNNYLNLCDVCAISNAKDAQEKKKIKIIRSNNYVFQALI
jgi:hypothetical protein